MSLQWYEKVEILRCDCMPDRVGKFGHIIGKSYENDDFENGAVAGYGVFFDDIGEQISFELNDVRGTGEVMDRAEFERGQSIRIRVVDGHGVPVRDEDSSG